MIQRAWRSESQLRDLLEDLPAGAYTCDLLGLITYFNRSAIQVWGRTPKLHDFADRFCGSYKLFAIEGAPIAHDQCWMALAIKNRRAYNGRDIIVGRPNGTRVNVLAHAYPLLNDTGDFFGAVNVLVDVGERSARENASEQSDRATTEFLASLARRQLNPFSPVRQASEILQLKSSSNQQVRWALEVLHRQSRFLKELLEDLLNLARITKNQNLLTEIRRIAEMYGGTISARNEAPYNESEFLVSLPAIHKPLRLLHKPNTKSRSLAPEVLPRILVMANDGDLPNGLSTLMRLLGNDVRTIHKRPEVVLDVEGLFPDVIFLDMRMPSEGDFEWVLLIRRCCPDKKMLLIAMIDSDQSIDSERLSGAGFDHLLITPVALPALALLLQQITLNQKEPPNAAQNWIEQ